MGERMVELVAQVSGDAGIEAFAQSVELALVQVYAMLAGSGKIRRLLRSTR